MSDRKSIWILMLVVMEIVTATALFLVGVETGATERTEAFQREATEAGFAQYDSMTGEWKWKTSGPKN